MNNKAPSNLHRFRTVTGRSPDQVHDVGRQTITVIELSPLCFRQMLTQHRPIMTNVEYRYQFAIHVQDSTNTVSVLRTIEEKLNFSASFL